MKKIFIIGLGLILTGLSIYFTIQLKKEPIMPNLEPIQQDIASLGSRLMVVENGTAKFGAVSIPDAPYLLQTSLAEPITTAATSMTLNNGTLRDGSTLTGYQCFTVDGGKVETEYICGTASGTAITSLVRGINPINPSATSSAAIYSHRRGADVRTTDYPIVQIMKRLINGQDSFPNVLSMDSTIATSTFTTYNLVNKSYVDGVALQGAPTATTTLAGIVQIATTAQVIAGTGMNGAYTLVPAVSLFSTTSSATTLIPVTNTSGKLSQGFLNLTEAFTWSGTHTFSGDVSGINDEWFGDGSDGDATISATTTLTSDKFYNSLTVNSGVSLITGSYKVFVKGTATINGTVSNNGGSGGNASGATGGTAGAGTPLGSIGTSTPGKVGTNGTTGGPGSNGGAGIAENNVVSGAGVAGGNGGGSGSDPGGTGGVAGTITTSASSSLRALNVALSLFDRNGFFVARSGSGSGAGGAGQGVGTGGGGGGSGANGGNVLIVAKTLVIGSTGKIQSNGGNGGNGGNGNGGGTGAGGGGGGAGGNGGILIVFYKTLTNSGVIQASGGTKGIGGTKTGAGTNGSDGTDGNAGFTFSFQLK